MEGVLDALSPSQRAVGSIARRALRGVRRGRIELVEGGRRELIGPSRADLAANLIVRDPRFWPQLARGSLGLGRSYAERLWESDDLTVLLRIAARELGRFDRLRGGLGRSRGALHRLRGLVPLNTHEGARQNIAAHYDLGNDLFEAFLDRRMQYSCAIFPAEGGALEEAQLCKLDRICGKLRLGPDDHLLEIGTGWGGLAAHAAGHYGCRVTTTTISREQRALARRRLAEAGLTDRVEVLDRDYRDLRGRYSKLVSVEMIEAVGWQYFDVFFSRCADLLEPGGMMLLQAITIPDRDYEAEKATRTFANTEVFPGGCLPSEGAIASCIGRVTDLRPIGSEQIGGHYAATLAAWRDRFLAGWGRLADSYDERFLRLWTFYLSYCEAGFREGLIGDVQLLFEKPAGDRPGGG